MPPKRSGQNGKGDRRRQNPSRRDQNKNKLFTLPARNDVIHRQQAPHSAVLTRTPLMPAFVQTKRMLYYEPNLSLSVPITGIPVSYAFTANGLYDPNITGSGHQPMGFDQMMSLYEQYTVVRSSITVTFRPHGSICFGVSLSPDTSAFTSSPGLVENGLSKYVCASGFATEVGGKFPSLTLHCDVRGYFGQRTSREMLNNTNLFGTAAANPTEQVYFLVNAWQGIGIAGGGISLDFECILAYDAIFWEPRKLGPSFKTPIPRFKDSDCKFASPTLVNDIMEKNVEVLVAPPPKKPPVSLDHPAMSEFVERRADHQHQKALAMRLLQNPDDSDFDLGPWHMAHRNTPTHVEYSSFEKKV